MNQYKETEYIIEAKNLEEHFHVSRNFTVNAVNGVSFGIRQGEVFGLVGESGCGKSTLARMISGMYRPSRGEVYFRGVKVSGEDGNKEMIKKMNSDCQMIFQDSAAALNPRMTIKKIILEPLEIQKRKPRPEETDELVEKALGEVGLSLECKDKTPSEMSGGQRQRVSIARSLMLEPSIIIADEPIAALDISIQAQIVTLFQRLQIEKNLAFLFIAHDISMVRFISDRIGVMLKGKLVEIGKTDDIFNSPTHPYTKALLSAIHIPDPLIERNKKILTYDRDMPLGDNYLDLGEDHLVLEY